MKIFFLLFIGILLIVFLVSSLLIYTIYFDKEVVQFIYDLGYSDFVRSTMIYSGMLLATFIIAYANYSIKLNDNNRKYSLYKNIGIFFFISMLSKILISYYISIQQLELHDSIFIPKKISFNHDEAVANSIYHSHGVKIEYYDLNKTKKMYEPSIIDLSIREMRNSTVDEMHRAPIYITISFILLICSFYYSNLLAIKIKRTEDREG